MVYLNKRLHKNDPMHFSANTQPGPVICISREVGCGGVNVAKLLAAELDTQTFCRKWKVLSKEILEESAKELSMDPGKLRSLLKEGDRNMFDDILSAFNERRHKSDKKISKTLVDLISSFANDGYCIIVGRGGHIITRNVERSLFIRLTAPLDWRIKQIMEKDKVNMREAIDFIERTDRERQNLIKYISHDKDVENEFDLSVNLARISIPEVISLIKHLAQTKGMLESKKSKVEVF